ncbi:beta-glucuronidase-like [Antedon mediterranea]|uniref:beta-glucuronidase-like n=1 Tax=Antedon mediterranea TaxID=105859 RepID=UPI003AF6DB12
MLYTKETESREVKELGGLWKFRADNSDGSKLGFEESWHIRPLSETGEVIDMPVPSSFNDITQDRKLRDFVGCVWYEKNFIPPKHWKMVKQRIFIKFESAHYHSTAWLNGQHIVSHEGGHLPFQAEVTRLIQFGSVNRITVAINNTLTPETLPPGTIKYPRNPNKYPKGYFAQNYFMDFFNYAGIHRPVKLHTTPNLYIDDITVVTNVTKATGVVDYVIHVKGSGCSSMVSYKIRLLDADGHEVAIGQTASGQLLVPNANLWWPYTMSDHPAYLYTLKVRVEDKTSFDVYDLPVGIRTVKLNKTKFLINDKPFYFLGIGKHEDADIRGRGFDYPIMVKDINLMKWLGINSFRTNHYPYAEEILDLCDEHGIVVIDESTAVGMKKAENFGDISFYNHISVMEELVSRDKNHPSVVMWSVANEPNSTLAVAGPYMKNIIKYTKLLDSTRPVTLVTGGDLKARFDQAAKYGDVICMNTYYSWYGDDGHLDVIYKQAEANLREWFDMYQRPVIQAEYGAGCIAGFHTDPPVMFSEEYQEEFLKEYFRVFDELRREFLVGEMVWVFADFMTHQSTKLAGGNTKGILTRQRQPKSVAKIIKQRYHQIGNSTTAESADQTYCQSKCKNAN